MSRRVAIFSKRSYGKVLRVMLPAGLLCTGLASTVRFSEEVDARDWDTLLSMDATVLIVGLRL